MRCGCPECGAFMIQAESEQVSCVCPECGYRCTDCLGTNTVVKKEDLKKLQSDPRFQKPLFDLDGDVPEHNDL